MTIPADAIIAVEKVRDYLLKPLDEDDKSGYLLQAGYTRANWPKLMEDMRIQLLPGEGIIQQRTRFGEKCLLRSKLREPNGNVLEIVTIWENNHIEGWKFITLYPAKKKRL